MTQTLASGLQPQKKYEVLGGYVGPMFKPPERLKAFLVGLPGEGKSNFLQSCPDAFIFNLDCSQTTTSDPQAVMWPGLDGQGAPVTGGGELTWDLVRDKLGVLKNLAKGNKTRPKLVAFDSLSAMMRLIMKWMPANADKLSIADGPREHWNQLHGQKSWPTLYDTVVDIIEGVSRLGYGVYLVGHITNSTIPIGEDKYVFKPELTITSKFWQRIYNMFELVALVSAERMYEDEEYEQVSMLRGEEKIERRKRTVERMKHFMTFDKAELEGITKTRVTLPSRIELPESGGWDHFHTVYMDSNASAHRRSHV